jgi:cell wall assembly regulator SMI1
MEAMRRKDLAGLKDLLDSGRVEVNQPCDGKLLLVEAVQAGADFVQALLQAGARANVQDRGNSTPLVKAASLGNVPALKALLAAGADPNHMPTTVTSPLGAAAEKRSPKTLDALQVLIAAGANVNAVFHSKDGLATGTVLFRACASGNVEAVRALLAAGADVNVVVLFGTALTKAAEGGHEEVVKALLEAGADPSLCVPDRPDRVPTLAGKSALELARQNRHPRVVALLAGASEPGAAVKSGDCRAAWRRLEAALKSKRPDVLETLQPGATAEDLTALAAAFERRLPAEAELFFQVHNGQKKKRASAFIRAGGEVDAPFRLLAVKEVIAEWRVWNGLVAKGEFRASTALPDPGVAKEWYHPGWLPLTTDGQGDHHCLDLAPAAGGRPGQVVMVWHDRAARPVVAGSLVEWLDDLAATFAEP